MGPLANAKVTLRFIGDELDPTQITGAIGGAPTAAERKGDGSRGERVAITGSWRLSLERQRSGDLDGQVAALLDMLTNDLDVWRELTAKYRADIFCGLFLDEDNEGLVLRPATLTAIGARGISLSLDIYAPATPSH